MGHDAVLVVRSVCATRQWTAQVRESFTHVPVNVTSVVLEHRSVVLVLESWRAEALYRVRLADLVPLSLA